MKEKSEPQRHGDTEREEEFDSGLSVWLCGSNQGGRKRKESKPRRHRDTENRFLNSFPTLWLCGSVVKSVVKNLCLCGEQISCEPGARLGSERCRSLPSRVAPRPVPPGCRPSCRPGSS